MDVLRKLEIKKKPVVNEVDEETPVHWVKPIKVGRFKLKKFKRNGVRKTKAPRYFFGVQG